jgi:hypothetical protein
MSIIGTRYLFQCKANYYNGIRPSNIESFNTEGFKKLVDIAKEYFDKGEIEDFSGFFEEYQYNVNLCTAHLILEYGDFNKELKIESIEIIKRYSTTPLDENLAKEEMEWLLENESKYIH